MKILIKDTQVGTLLGFINEMEIPFKKDFDELRSKYGEIKNLAILYYKENDDQHNDLRADAFRHILASAYFTNRIGDTPTRYLGKGNELAGYFRNPVQNLKNLFTGKQLIDSGKDMDIKNNEIGIGLGRKYGGKNKDFKFFEVESKKIVDSGNFYVEDGKTLFKNFKSTT